MMESTNECDLSQNKFTMAFIFQFMFLLVYSNHPC